MEICILLIFHVLRLRMQVMNLKNEMQITELYPGEHFEIKVNLRVTIKGYLKGSERKQKAERKSDRGAQRERQSE